MIIGQQYNMGIDPFTHSFALNARYNFMTNELDIILYAYMYTH